MEAILAGSQLCGGGPGRWGGGGCADCRKLLRRDPTLQIDIMASRDKPRLVIINPYNLRFQLCLSKKLVLLLVIGLFK